jgi:predicted nucleic-acid-binding Zn-ribbon protein
LDMRCSKCGSSDVLPNVPVVSSSDNISSVPVSALAYNKPDAWVFKGPVTHRFVARICGACGFAEFYVEDSKALFEAVNKVADT